MSGVNEITYWLMICSFRYFQKSFSGTWLLYFDKLLLVRLDMDTHYMFVSSVSNVYMHVSRNVGEFWKHNNHVMSYTNDLWS